VLDRLRGKLQSNLEKVGEFFAGLEGSPTAWTAIGLVVSLLAGYAYSMGAYWGSLLGGLLILVSGWFDLVDGAVARATGRVSKGGAFLDSTFDRVAEVGIFFGILWGGFAAPPLVLLALSASLLVSYTRAKGDSLGVTLSGVGIGERSERLLVLAAASILGLAVWGVFIVLIIASYTFLERTLKAARALAMPT
jgi:archaetidylinositol phosphate synthase